MRQNEMIAPTEKRRRHVSRLLSSLAHGAEMGMRVVPLQVRRLPWAGNLSRVDLRKKTGKSTSWWQTWTKGSGRFERRRRES